jgi:hypothetical protein
MLCCVVLCCVVLRCVVLCCVVLCCVVLCCAVLCCVVCCFSCVVFFVLYAVCCVSCFVLCCVMLYCTLFLCAMFLTLQLQMVQRVAPNTVLLVHGISAANFKTGRVLLSANFPSTPLRASTIYKSGRYLADFRIIGELCRIQPKPTVLYGTALTFFLLPHPQVKN